MRVASVSASLSIHVDSPGKLYTRTFSSGVDWGAKERSSMALAVSVKGWLSTLVRQTRRGIGANTVLLWRIMPWIIGPAAHQNLARCFKRSQTALNRS
jgi:hypothetical protein